jgi:hypothetical protein
MGHEHRVDEVVGRKRCLANHAPDGLVRPQPAGTVLGEIHEVTSRSKKAKDENVFAREHFTAKTILPRRREEREGLPILKSL